MMRPAGPPGEPHATIERRPFGWQITLHFDDWMALDPPSWRLTHRGAMRCAERFIATRRRVDQWHATRDVIR